MALSDDQKDQLQDLVHYTILPALTEDLALDTVEEEAEAINCIIDELKRIRK